MWSCNAKYMYYEISRTGEIRDTILELPVPHKINRDGYITVYLPYAAPRCRRRNGTRVYTHTLHTVVADTFLPPPKIGQTIVDHILRRQLHSVIAPPLPDGPVIRTCYKYKRIITSENNISTFYTKFPR